MTPETPAGGLTTAVDPTNRRTPTLQIGGLPADERYRLAASGDHGPETCDCDAYAPDQGYPADLICEGLAHTFTVAAQIKAAAVVQARAEDRARIEAAMRELCDTAQNDALRISRAMIALGENGPGLLAALERDRAAGRPTATEDGDRP